MKFKHGAYLALASAISAAAGTSVSAAEVVYLGEAQSLSGETERPYTLKERAADLANFKAYGETSGRSGWITGNLVQEIDNQAAGGNRAKSFLTRGNNYLTELNLTVFERLLRAYNFEGQFSLRKTDNAQIEESNATRLKRMTLKVSNPDNMLEFGDFYADLSQFVLGTSLQGFHLELNPSPAGKYKLLAARQYSADSSVPLYQRNTYGFKAQRTADGGPAGMAGYRLGLQGALTLDADSSLSNAPAAPRLYNDVVSVDGDAGITKDLSCSFELARSKYTDDEDAPTIDGAEGWALRLQPAWKAGRFKTRYLFYRVQPEFRTEAGSAAPDRQRHQLGVDWRPEPELSFSLSENLYWDDLPGSPKEKRTTNNEQYFKMSARPLPSRRNLTVSPYLNVASRSSDDAENTLSARTVTAGLSASDTFGDGTAAGLRYEYRDFSDRYNNSNSETAHRAAADAARDFRLFSKRLSLAAGVTADFRKPEGRGRDTMLNLSGSADYQPLDILKARAGFNLTNSDAAAADAGYRNTRSFAELDFRVHKKRSSHLVLRAGRAVYKYDDPSQNYSESVYSAAFTSNF